jgi:uncharacterized membrane protein YfcA
MSGLSSTIVTGAGPAGLLAGTGFLAGVMNALAGGGTILTFPAMLSLGMGPLAANGTSTVALVPGAFSSFWAYRGEVGAHRDWLRLLVLPSLLGGAVGSLLLLLTPEKVFGELAPWLVLFATLLFLTQILRGGGRSAPGPGAGPGGASESGPEATLPGQVAGRRRATAWVAQFLVAVYGGYFGAGIGILMLVLLGWLSLTDILAMNGLKNFLGTCINGMACACFVVGGLVDWPAAIATGVGAVAGGFAGARFARHVGRTAARWAVVVVGLVVTAAMLLTSR